MNKLRSLAVGDVLVGRFRLERSLGIGGMAQVFRAVDQLLEKTCAIKAMQGALAGDSTLVERFVREGRATAQIQSPHVITVTDALTTESGIPFIVMEYLEGFDLARLESERGRLPVTDVLSYLGQACVGLEAAHRLGIVHRDVKLQNIFVQAREGEEIVRLVDFGLARIRSVGGGLSPARLTAMDAVVGTVSYLAPEQVRSSHDVDARTDIWAMGVCLYRLLTGVLPFRGGTEAQVMAEILSQDPEPLAKHTASAQPTLQAIVSKCLAKSPAARYGTAAELGDALAQVGDIAKHAAHGATLHGAPYVAPAAPRASTSEQPRSPLARTAPPAADLPRAVVPQAIHIVAAADSIPSPSASTNLAPFPVPLHLVRGNPAPGLRADHKLLLIAVGFFVFFAACAALSRPSPRASGPPRFEAPEDDKAASGASAAPAAPAGPKPQEEPRRALSAPQLR